MCPQSIPGQLVRSFAVQGNIRFTLHALDRMDERLVEADAVVDAIARGHEIEVQPATDVDPDIRVLFQEAGGVSFYVVTICRNMIVWSYLFAVPRRSPGRLCREFCGGEIARGDEQDE